jgi:septal ring factor EnvC (AmiA/AmiB activator)
MSTTPDERAHIHEAMQRIFDGTARRSTGALTIVALAQEAGVPRNALTQRHTDLRNEFYQRVQERGATPDVEIRLRAQIAKLKKTVANKDEELTRLRSDVPALVRVINQITAENAELREALTMPPANVIPLSRGTGSSTESGTPDVQSDDRHP